MPDAHKNFAYSLVAIAPTPASSGTALTVTAGVARFPTVPFNASVWPAGAQPIVTNAEIVRVTAIATDTLTITRAQEGTSARSIIVGDQIAATITAKTLTDIETENIARTIVDAKGDLIVATAADTVGRLAVGAQSSVLTSDSGTATGLGWYRVQGWRGTLIGDSSVIGNTAAATIMNKSITVPAYTLLAGAQITWVARFIVNTKASAAGTLAFDVYISDRRVGYQVIGLGDGWVGNLIYFRGDFIVRSDGAGGSIMTIPSVLSINMAGAYGGAVFVSGIEAMDTTVSNAFGVNVTFSVADPANQVMMQGLWVNVEYADATVS